MAKRKIQPQRDIGPLAELSRMCDHMEDMIEDGLKYYPEVFAALRRLDHTITWEIQRLRWEIAFMASLETGDKPKSTSRRKKLDPDALTGLTTVLLNAAE